MHYTGNFNQKEVYAILYLCNKNNTEYPKHIKDNSYIYIYIYTAHKN